ncbi:MAG: type II secretion system F family protein, partial [Cellulomonadaceae bacterium]
HLTAAERILYALLAFAVGGFVGHLFFGGLGKTSSGAPTTFTHVWDAIVVVIVGTLAARHFLRLRADQIRRTKVRGLEHQFRDLLDSLTTSLASGSTIVRAFDAARDDLSRQYADDAPIVQELNTIVAGFHNNVRIEDMVADLGERSGSDDIQSFANVFQIAYHKGADMKEAVRNTHLILSEKMTMTEEIQTSLVANKNESLIMVALPIFLVAMLKNSGSSFGDALSTPAGFVCTVVAVGLFIAAYALSRKIMAIKV